MPISSILKSFPQTISADGTTFLDDQHQPFFWLGDTAWPLFTQYHREEALDYLDDRAAKGFTVIQCVLVWFGGDRPEPGGISANAYGVYPWINRDPASPDPKFFEHVDFLLTEAEQRGLSLAIIPTWGNMVTDMRLFTPDIAQAYGFWLGDRYKAQPNIVWINGGDCLPHGFEAIFDALADGLRAGDGGTHLITYHPCHLHSSSLFNDRSWLDFHMIQTWTDWHQVYQSVLTDTMTLPRRPIVLGEGAYENGPEYPRGPITDLVARRQAWWAFMAGGYYTFGQDKIWRMGENWTKSFSTPGARQMTIFRQVVKSVPWWHRIPDQAIIESGQNEGEILNTAVRGDDGRWAMVYLSSRCHVLVRLEKLLTNLAQATWVNPATGEQKDAGQYETYTMPGFRQVRTSRFQWFATPDHWEDAVLILTGIDL